MNDRVIIDESETLFVFVIADADDEVFFVGAPTEVPGLDMSDSRNNNAFLTMGDA